MKFLKRWLKEKLPLKKVIGSKPERETRLERLRAAEGAAYFCPFAVLWYRSMKIICNKIGQLF